MTEIICAALAMITAIIVAVIETRNHKQHKRTEARAEMRAQESRLSMEMMYANCALALITAKKLAGMHTNGDVEEAMNAAREAQKAYEDFVRDLTAEKITK